MRVAIVGSRDYPRLDEVRDYVRTLPGNSVVVSGGARGVDKTAEDTARECGLEVVVYKADWKNHGKGAGFLRNKDIVENADAVAAFWDGVSHGTRHSMSIAWELKKPLAIFKNTGIGETQVTLHSQQTKEEA